MHCSAGVWTEHKQDRFSHGDLPFGIYYTLCGNGVISWSFCFGAWLFSCHHGNLFYYCMECFMWILFYLLFSFLTPIWEWKLDIIPLASSSAPLFHYLIFFNCFFYPKEIKSNMSQSQTLILDDRNLSMVSHVALLSMSCMDSLSSYNCVLLITINVKWLDKFEI